MTMSGYNKRSLEMTISDDAEQSPEMIMSGANERCRQATNPDAMIGVDERPPKMTFSSVNERPPEMMIGGMM